ncbi:elongator complex protein [Ophiocordyceps camponoti-floridani]|uniref:Elongator complex protein 1 n=1 Tax=Ophiocordyceps camponoti-floridani TaxID=2030778 RepID=A0A8H4Q6L4_9HYPO|nr:elongator complex protein [Ophiocordyceps camponoti-floridani]
MRNLRNASFVRQTLARASSPCLSVCWDPDTDDVICAVGPTAQRTKIEVVRLSHVDGDSPRTVAIWDAPSPHPDLAIDRVVDIHYIGGSATTCLVLEGGDVITVREGKSAGDAARVEIVGSIDAGIAAAAWSPDEEQLAVVTKTDTLILMTSFFDPVADIALTSDDIRASKYVSVGWGKKETQFQGRGAKALRDPTIPEKVDQGLPSAYEDGAITISWRGDAAYVAVNSTRQSDRRVVRIYSRQGQLESATEPVDGLEASLSWRPSGNLLAGIQRKDDGVDVVFFEKNGLRHGEFPLRCPAGAASSKGRILLQWNADSTVLAVIYHDALQLWTMSNYHWYLKQEIPLDDGVSWLAWHPEKALRFAAVSSAAIITTEHTTSTARGSCRPPYDNGTVAVIDGRTIKLTPFRAANVPPPMSLFEVEAECPVIDVTMGRRNESFAILHQKGVDLYDMPAISGRSVQPRLKARVPFPETLRPLRLCCVATGLYRCIAYRDGGGCLHLGINAEAGRMEILADKRDLVSTSTLDDGSLVEGFGQDLSGNLYRLSDSSSEPLSIRFLAYLPWFEIVKLESVVLAFGLSRNGHLYANDRVLAKNCTSFLVTPNHIVFTTSNHYVKFVHLDPDVDDLEVPEDEPEKDERCRGVERGSCLVVAMPTNMSLVLQMPRGNVETIFPRAMVVSGIRSLIEDKKYGRAFSYCRTQRVDMNILYDHRPTQFLSSVSQFLDQLAEVSYIDLFLSSLREEDVTKTMYQDTKRRLPEAHETMDKSSSTASKNMLTAHMCKLPPALDDGLMLVTELMKEDEQLADKAIEHVCFLVDVNRVYENALGLYELDLALLVAQQSQRDPREHVPFIQKLHSLPELRRRFEIDDHLGRRNKALKSLQALDAFDELCEYTTQHTLYREALKLYRYHQPRLQTLTRLYAEHLESQSAHREAGLAYESLDDFSKATSCYRAAGPSCWQECLFTAQMQQSPRLSEEAMIDLATSLSDALYEAKDYSSAATIHLEHLSSLEGAVRCLCKGSKFAEAIRLVMQRNRPDLLQTAVDVGLAEAAGSTTEFLADCKAQLQSQVPRITELRRRAEEDPLSFYEGERVGGVGIPDDVSLAASSRLSTSASLFTRYTGSIGTGVSRASSKNRRREEKKRARGRKGTVYEEEYLVNSVRRLVERVAASTVDLDALLAALVRRRMMERARAVDVLAVDVVAGCAEAVAELWARTAEPVLDEGRAREAPSVPSLKRLVLLA